MHASKNKTTETFVSAGGCAVTVHSWSNGSGITFTLDAVTNGTNPVIVGTLNWEQADALVLAIQAARCHETCHESP